jgi:hypothetical protein
MLKNKNGLPRSVILNLIQDPVNKFTSLASITNSLRSNIFILDSRGTTELTVEVLCGNDGKESLC